MYCTSCGSNLGSWSKRSCPRCGSPLRSSSAGSQNTNIPTEPGNVSTPSPAPSKKRTGLFWLIGFLAVFAALVVVAWFVLDMGNVPFEKNAPETAEQVRLKQVQKEQREREQREREQREREQREQEQSGQEQRQEEQEQRLQEQRLQEQRLQEQRLLEQRLQEQRLQERRLQEQKLHEQKLHEQKLQEQKLQEQRLQEQREQEQRLQEQRLQEQREREQKEREQKEREQRERVQREGHPPRMPKPRYYKMLEELGQCPDFRCHQRVLRQYCPGYWGTVPECKQIL